MQFFKTKKIKLNYDNNLKKLFENKKMQYFSLF